jgi:excisionase family DNA binding protein
MDKRSNGRELTDITGVSRYLSVSVNTAYGWVNQRKIPFFKVGRLLRFDLSEIDAWLSERKISPYGE